MSWFGWLALAVIVTGVAAVTGMKPKGTRHVARTSVMGVARVFLWIIAIVLVLQAWRTH